MPPRDTLAITTEDSPELEHARPTSGRLLRQASASSVLVGVSLIAVAVIAISIRQPMPSTPPAGAVGIAGSPGPTEPLGSWLAIVPSPGPTASEEGSTKPSAPSSAAAQPTPWQTSPPSGCHPYVKPCDPTIMPVYPYVSVIITTNGSTDADLGVGKVTILADGHTFTCSTYSKPASCYFEVPPGTEVTATAYNHTGSMCTSFQVMWEDHSSIWNHDCSPLTFTTNMQKAQVTANFDLVPTAPPVSATEPPVATPPPATTPPLETPVDTPLDSLVPG